VLTQRWFAYEQTVVMLLHAMFQQPADHAVFRGEHFGFAGRPGIPGVGDAAGGAHGAGAQDPLARAAGFEFPGHFLVVTELLGMEAASAGEGAEDGGVLVEFLLGDVGADDLHAVGAVHAEDFAAAAGEVADDIAHAFVGDADFDDADGFEQAGAGGEEGFAEGFFAGDLEGDVLGIDRVHFAVVEVDLEIDDAVAGEDAFAGRRP
jgi:hypothetical protein